MRFCGRIGWGVAIGVAALLCVAVIVRPVDSATGKSRDLVVLDHERWLDTLKGTVKNFSKQSARDVTLVVKFLDKKRKPLGTQRVSLGDLRSGDQTSWSLAIGEKQRAATHYTFETHALWQ
jgi:hypothetical protein